MAKRILVVDDDRDLVQTLHDTLTMEGFEVISAYDGVEGLAMIKKGKPDLVILDVMMPNKHGYQMAKDLAQSEHSGIPVIMLTGVAEQLRGTNFSHAQALDCPADDFISKPLNVEILLKSIRRLLKVDK
jgi:DNA-binding response OmpR family regulator